MPPSYSEKDKQFIADNCSYMTVPELSAHLDLKPGIVYQLLKKLKLTAKSAKVERTIHGVILNPNRIRVFVPDKPKQPLIRAKGEYSNSGYEEVKRKYL